MKKTVFLHDKITLKRKYRKKYDREVEQWKVLLLCFLCNEHFFVLESFRRKREMCKIPAINGKWHMYRAICGKQNAKYAEFCIFC